MSTSVFLSLSQPFSPHSLHNAEQNRPSNFTTGTLELHRSARLLPFGCALELWNLLAVPGHRYKDLITDEDLSELQHMGPFQGVGFPHRRLRAWKPGPRREAGWRGESGQQALFLCPFLKLLGPCSWTLLITAGERLCYFLVSDLLCHL